MSSEPAAGRGSGALQGAQVVDRASRWACASRCWPAGCSSPAVAHHVSTVLHCASSWMWVQPDGDQRRLDADVADLQESCERPRLRVGVAQADTPWVAHDDRVEDVGLGRTTKHRAVLEGLAERERHVGIGPLRSYHRHVREDRTRIGLIGRRRRAVIVRLEAVRLACRVGLIRVAKAEAELDVAAIAEVGVELVVGAAKGDQVVAIDGASEPLVRVVVRSS